MVACKVSTNLDQVIALDIGLPYGGQVEVGDTLVPTARALNGHGDSVGAEIVWVALDTSAIRLIDTATGAVEGKALGSDSLQAQVDLLRSNPIRVTVIAHLDSVLALGPTLDTVIVSADSLSDSLSVQLFASPSAAIGRRVIFTATTFPASGPLFTFVPNDTVSSSGTGIAATRLRLDSGSSLPDSIVVLANVSRPDGTPILGSPVKFLVAFLP
ncbi:MAG TPA: hypothetical protein VKD28_12675 [Gemmatimonadales bacterium]|nr:hypothetical protein [Gemmatimonadales bacterium]